MVYEYWPILYSHRTGCMTDRQSKLTKSDCLWLHRVMSEAQLKILEYIGNGCPKTGFRDDMFLCTKLMELRDIIKEKVE